MEPIQLAASAVTLIVPYFAKAGEEVAKKVGEATWNRMVKVYELIRDKLSSDKDTYAETTLERFGQSPDIEARQIALADILGEKIAGDDAFATNITNLIQEVTQGQEIGTFVTHVYGNAKVGKLINIASAGVVNIN